VGWYLANSAYTEREATWQADQKKATDALSTATRALENVSNIKKILGEDYEAVGTPDDQNANTVIGAMKAKIALAGDLAQATYSATLLKLVEEINTCKNTIATADATLPR